MATDIEVPPYFGNSFPGPWVATQFPTGLRTYNLVVPSLEIWISESPDRSERFTWHGLLWLGMNDRDEWAGVYNKYTDGPLVLLHDMRTLITQIVVDIRRFTFNQ
jgi:hypothetical protein